MNKYTWILRSVMAGGAGILIYSAIGVFLCLPSVPFDVGNCIAVTAKEFSALAEAGFTVTIMVGTTVLGGLFYFITGKWKKN